LAQGIDELKDAGPFPDVPLRLIVRDTNKAIDGLIHGAHLPESEARAVEELHARLMANLLLLSPHSQWITAKGGSHMLHLTEPETLLQVVSEFCH
jgi:pimeloyl-ACP methyl ester carboxylesterase